MKLSTIIGKSAVCALPLALVVPHVPGAAAVELDASYYVVGTQLSAWYKPVVKPPKGWVENPQWSEKYQRLVLFENGDTSRDKPIMYVRAHLAEDMPLATYIKVAQERWLAKLEDSTIEPLADVPRPGTEPIKVFLYKNPSQAEQAYELTAFIKDRDSKNPRTSCSCKW